MHPLTSDSFASQRHFAELAESSEDPHTVLRWLFLNPRAVFKSKLLAARNTRADQSLQ